MGESAGASGMLRDPSPGYAQGQDDGKNKRREQREGRNSQRLSGVVSRGTLMAWAGRGIFLAFYVSGDAYRDGAGRDGFGGEADGSEHGVFANVGSCEDGGVIGDAGVGA